MVRTVTGTAHPPSLLTFAAETLARLGRLLPLALPLAFVDLLITATASSSPKGARLVSMSARWVTTLCNTAVALGCVGAYLLTAAILVLVRHPENDVE